MLQLIWTKGRQLASTVKGGVTTTYTYNADGIRIGKTVGGTAVEYMLDGSQILAEKNGSTVLRYFYDANSSPVGMMIGSTYYLYEKNLQGDIVGIYTTSGLKVASYSYDAWGNTVSSSYTSGYQTAHDLNPFRYRGYYYDTESGFYYLQSRYYDPATGRFLNADGYVNANGDLQGFNMYAYCSNNPVMYRDDSGEGVLFVWLFIGISALIGATWMGIESYSDGNRGWTLFEDIVKGFSIGLVVSGSVVMLGAVFKGAAYAWGHASTATVFGGVPIAQALAIGALAYNFVAIFIAPFLGIDMEPIELDQSSVPTIPNPTK